MSLVWYSAWKEIIFLNSINLLIPAMVKCGVLFEVRTEFLNIIYKTFGFKEREKKRDTGKLSNSTLVIWLLDSMDDLVWIRVWVVLTHR
jgi:hypothetical protein